VEVLQNFLVDRQIVLNGLGHGYLEPVLEVLLGVEDIGH